MCEANSCPGSKIYSSGSSLLLVRAITRAHSSICRACPELRICPSEPKGSEVKAENNKADPWIQLCVSQPAAQPLCSQLPSRQLVQGLRQSRCGQRTHFVPLRGLAYPCWDLWSPVGWQRALVPSPIRAARKWICETQAPASNLLPCGSPALTGTGTHAHTHVHTHGSSEAQLLQQRASSRGAGWAAGPASLATTAGHPADWPCTSHNSLALHRELRPVRCCLWPWAGYHSVTPRAFGPFRGISSEVKGEPGYASSPGSPKRVADNVCQHKDCWSSVHCCLHLYWYGCCWEGNSTFLWFHWDKMAPGFPHPTFVAHADWSGALGSRRIYKLSQGLLDRAVCTACSLCLRWQDDGSTHFQLLDTICCFPLNWVSVASAKSWIFSLELL